MNGLEQVRESIKNFICEKKQVQQQIREIEEKREQLAQQRNEKKKANMNNEEVNKLGKEISELGDQSQELQNKLDFRCHAIKEQINLSIDNLIAEGIRKIRKINEEIQELEYKIENQKERNAKYQLQKQEFYVRFGRMPELSENAVEENKLQQEECKKNVSKIQELKLPIGALEEEITELAKTKREFKSGNWNSIIVSENETEEIYIKEINVEEIGTIEEIHVEEFEPIEELYVEEFEPIEELYVEEFKGIEEFQTETVETIETTEESPIDEIEELAKAIIEEITTEQTKDFNVKSAIEEVVEDIIAFEEKNEKKEKVIIPLFGQKATISNITVKFEETELVYKAQMSDGNEIKIYPAKIGTENVLLRDKQNREECREILMKYAVVECKVFDGKVVNKIDPLICELLIECAQEYDYDAQELIYNYAMSFSNDEYIDTEIVPAITYNISYIKGSALSKKERTIINKICKNARGNNKIDIIESFTGFRKIKYILKRIFAVNNINVLPETKY